MKSKPKAGMSLHKFVATGGKPKNYKKLNNMSEKLASSVKSNKK